MAKLVEKVAIFALEKIMLRPCGKARGGRKGMQIRRIRPGQTENNEENQSVGGNLEIEVRQAVQRDRQETSKTSQRYRLFRSARATVETPGALQQHVEDRAEKQQCGRDAEFGSKFQIVVVGVTHKFTRESSLYQRVGNRESAKTR